MKTETTETPLVAVEEKDKIKEQLNWNNIYQLHDAISNFSKQSFDIKKLWITVEGSVITFLLTRETSDLHFLLTVCGVILVFFYLLDSMTYYYQDKLREKMVDEQNAIRKLYDINEKPFDRDKCRIMRSLLNSSHLLYYTVFCLIVFIYNVC